MLVVLLKKVKKSHFLELPYQVGLRSYSLSLEALAIECAAKGAVM